MLKVPDDVVGSDLTQWLNRGVVMVQLDAKPDSELVPCGFVGPLSNDTVSVTPIYRDRIGRNVEVGRNRLYVHWPRCGSVNVLGRGYAIHVDRLTQRQYRRTWNYDCVQVIVPREFEASSFTGMDLTPRTLNRQEVARACFYPTYPQHSEAEGMLARGEAISVALTPRVILAGDPAGKRMLYYNGQLVASGVFPGIHPLAELDLVRRALKPTGGLYHVENGF